MIIRLCIITLFSIILHSCGIERDSSLSNEVIESMRYNVQCGVDFDMDKKFVLEEIAQFEWDTVLLFWDDDSNTQNKIKVELSRLGIINNNDPKFISYPVGGNRNLFFFIKNKKVVKWFDLLYDTRISIMCGNIENSVEYLILPRQLSIFYVLQSCNDRSNFTVIPSSCFVEEKNYWLNEYK